MSNIKILSKYLTSLGLFVKYADANKDCIYVINLELKRENYSSNQEFMDAIVMQNNILAYLCNNKLNASSLNASSLNNCIKLEAAE